jgi:hypothetical protein
MYMPFARRCLNGISIEENDARWDLSKITRTHSKSTAAFLTCRGLSSFMTISTSNNHEALDLVAAFDKVNECHINH